MPRRPSSPRIGRVSMVDDAVRLGRDVHAREAGHERVRAQWTHQLNNASPVSSRTMPAEHKSQMQHYRNEPDFTSPARRYFAMITPLGETVLSTRSNPA